MQRQYGMIEPDEILESHFELQDVEREMTDDLKRAVAISYKEQALAAMKLNNYGTASNLFNKSWAFYTDMVYPQPSDDALFQDVVPSLISAQKLLAATVKNTPIQGAVHPHSIFKHPACHEQLIDAQVVELQNEIIGLKGRVSLLEGLLLPQAYLHK